MIVLLIEALNIIIVITHTFYWINHTHNMIIDGHLVPTKKYAYNPQYLEVISNTLNTIHGIFVRDFDLADMNVPAFKVPFLLELIKDKSKDEAREIILEYL